jgi:hypothetical protein
MQMSQYGFIGVVHQPLDNLSTPGPYVSPLAPTPNLVLLLPCHHLSLFVLMYLLGMLALANFPVKRGENS